MENIKTKGSALILSFLLLPFLASSQAQDTATVHKKKTTAKSTTSKSSGTRSSKTPVKTASATGTKRPAATHTAATHHVVTARAASGVTVKKPVRTSTGSAANRRPR